MIRVRLLGAIRSLVGADHLIIDGESARLSDIVKELKGIDWPSLLIFVNGREASSLDGPDTVVREGDDVVVLSVIHGGSIFDLDEDHVGIVLGLRIDDPISRLEGLRRNFDGSILQMIRPEALAGELHARLLIEQCHEAMKRSLLYAKSAEIDLLMRIGCEDQIGKALKEVGVREGSGKAVLIGMVKREDVEGIVEELRGLVDREALECDAARARSLMDKHGFGMDAMNATIVDDPLAYLLSERAALMVSGL